jgi:type II secretory pathway component PulJ
MSRGFTLLEALISTALGALICVTLLQLSAIQYQGYRRFIARQSFWQARAVVDQHLRDSIQQAVQILPESSSDQLCLLEGDPAPTRIVYQNLPQGVRKKIGNSYHYLTDRGVVQSLSFRYPPKQVCYVLTLKTGAYLESCVVPRTKI